MTEPVNNVRMIVNLRFEGDYFDPDELVDVASGWIYAGLEDRDNLVGTKITGELLPTSDTEEAA
ncbi:hypothetical protein ACIBCT_35215 [Streptosporangium sp. NPDC050855]|uniref:hypothetical protein n=1 Tax=Streptosporangium sp. NPDC050855 TaxID=3366194 RepID=UPI0037B51D1F